MLQWHIGLAVMAIVDAFIASLFYSTLCEAPELAQFLVLVATAITALRQG